MKTIINGYEVEALNRKAQVKLVHEDPFIQKVRELRDNGYSEREVAEFFGMSIVDMRKEINRKLKEEREKLVKEAAKLREDGKSTREIAILLGRNESSVRLLLDDKVKV